MSGEAFSKNHYVPQWYQKNFLLNAQNRFHYLDLNPEWIENNGHRYRRKGLLRWGTQKCFSEDDLYTIAL